MLPAGAENALRIPGCWVIAKLALTYGPPRPQVACFPRLNSLQKRIRPSRRGVWPRWRSARSGPHKGGGVERHLTPEGSRTPFDCQAIFLLPLADNVPDEGLVEYLLQAAIASAS